MPTKACIVKAMNFPVVMYGCENWTIKKAECQRIDAFELWCWRRLLRVPWMARKTNQSTLKKINPGYSLEGLTLKLKLQYFGHLMWRTDSLEKTLILGKTEGRRRRGWQKIRWLDGITNSMGHEIVQALGVARQWRTVDGQWSLVCLGCPASLSDKESDMTEQLELNWTELIWHKALAAGLNQWTCWLFLLVHDYLVTFLWVSIQITAPSILFLSEVLSDLSETICREHR